MADSAVQDSPPKLTWAFDLTLTGVSDMPIKPTQYSAICAAHVIGGTLTSADGQTNLDVRVGCDWMTVHSDYAEIDARVCCNSPPSDGRALNLDLEYKGRINLSEMAVQLMGGMGETVDAAYYFTTVYLSSRSAELSWVNSSVFVGNGKLMANKDNAPVVRYRIYRVS